MSKQKFNLLDRFILAINPAYGFKRMQYRNAVEFLGKQRRYEAAAAGRRTQGWITSSTSANSEIHTALTLLRNRSRDLVRNNPYAKKAVREIANNVVGTGIVPNPVIQKPKLEAERIKNTWKAWADSTQCDYDGHLNFYGLQHLAMLSVAESGECIIRKHINKDLPFPLQLQILEPDFIDTTKYADRLEDGGYIYYGVEFNGKNQVVAYWLWPNHPGDQLQFNLTSSRIPATELIHLFVKERPGQFRGVPVGHASMLRMNDLAEFEDAQLIRQKIAQCFTVFVTDNSIGVPGVIGSDDDYEPLEKVEPGIIERLPAGKQVTMASPPDAGPNYEPYTKSILRAISAGYGMDYVSLTGDLLGVNFSSGRMGWLQFHRNIGIIQWNTFVPMFCDKVWQWFMGLAVITGAAKTQLVAVRWTPPKREMIDPTKEGMAQKEMVRAGFTSAQEVIRENGLNPEDVLQQQIEDRKSYKDAGLSPEWDPGADAERISGQPSSKKAKPDSSPEE